MVLVVLCVAFPAGFLSSHPSGELCGAGGHRGHPRHLPKISWEAPWEWWLVGSTPPGPQDAIVTNEGLDCLDSLEKVVILVVTGNLGGG